MSVEETDCLSVEDLLDIAAGVMRGLALKDPGLLAAAAARPSIRVFGDDAYPTWQDKAATLLHSLARDHAIVDGNNRLAWSATRVFCLINGRDLTYTVDEAEELTLGAAAGRLGVPEISAWLAAKEAPAPGPVPKRLVVDVETVRQLVTEQFPQWSKLPIAPVGDGGWDNWTFHLGNHMLVRLPSAAEYALAVAKERRWLPRLARQLPLPIPTPLGNGVPGAGYPFSWSIYGWLDGNRAAHGRIADPVRFAVDLADFLVCLRGIDAAAGPQPGVHNWYRGATLRTYDQTTRSSLAKLVDHVDGDLVAEIWSVAVAAPWDGVDVWFHGDLSEGNLLLKDGRLAAVIDFGTCGVGDPACDLAIAWTLLTKPGRPAFRDRLGVDDATWARGRGWALWKTLAQYSGAIEEADSDDAAKALRVLNDILDEYQGSLG